MSAAKNRVLKVKPPNAPDVTVEPPTETEVESWHLTVPEWKRAGKSALAELGKGDGSVAPPVSD